MDADGAGMVSLGTLGGGLCPTVNDDIILSYPVDIGQASGNRIGYV